VSRRIRLVAVALTGLVLAGGGTALAQSPQGGRISIGGEEVALGAPLWIWDAEAQFLSFAFFTDPPSPDLEEAARRAGHWDDLPGRRVLFDLEFTAGQSMAMADQVVSCRLTAIGFRAELELEGRASDCHILSVGGLLRPGGGVIGVLQGDGAGYSLFLPFSMTMGDVMTAGAGGAAPPAARPPLPSNTVEGTATFDGQTLTVTHGLAWWDEPRGQVRLGLFEREPPAGMLADMQGGSWGEGGPVVLLHFEVAREATVSVASVDYCYVSVSFPRGGVIGNNTNAQGCGLDEFGGEIVPGGHVAAGLSGQASGPGDKPYTWTLRFNLPLAR
jgi:hypothetical protein